MTTKRIAHKDKTRVLVLVGTRKGAFIFESNRNRKKWSVSGPHFAGWSVHHLIHDARVGGAGMLLAALNHDVYGPNIQHSTDLGQTWQMADGPAFAKDSGQSVKKVWHVQPGHASRPSEVWAGVDPASLFKSEDGGHTWSPVPGLNDHPTRAEYWQPGAGGLILHGIVPHATDANRMWVAISAAGVFRTDDGGATWQPRNRGTQACFLPEGKQWPDVGQCCHHLLVSPTRPELLFQQNHCGMYRSDNGGDEWTNIGEGLPSHFGFALGIPPREPETVYVAPEVSDEYRYMPEGAMAVYRSRTGGRDWERLASGLPANGAFLNVLREGLATDSCDPGGVYVGTSTGQVFYSRDEGDNWNLLADYLPPVYSIATAVVEE